MFNVESVMFQLYHCKNNLHN